MTNCKGRIKAVQYGGIRRLKAAKAFVVLQSHRSGIHYRLEIAVLLVPVFFTTRPSRTSALAHALGTSGEFLQSSVCSLGYSFRNSRGCISSFDLGRARDRRSGLLTRSTSQPDCNIVGIESDRAGDFERRNLTFRRHPVDFLDRYIQDSSEFLDAQSFLLAFNNFGQDHRFLRSLREQRVSRPSLETKVQSNRGDISLFRKGTELKASFPELAAVLEKH